MAEGRFVDEIVPLSVTKQKPGKKKGHFELYEETFETDEGPRGGQQPGEPGQAAAGFHAGRHGDRGQLLPDERRRGRLGLHVQGAGRALGLKPLLTYRSYAVAGVDPRYMGIGPVKAIPKALGLAGKELGDIELVELNEAFASQALYCIRELGLDPNITNVNGGAIALGHPLGCTGAKLTTQLAYEMQKRDLRWGLVSMCIGFGMGAAGVFEREKYDW